METHGQIFCVVDLITGFCSSASRQNVSKVSLSQAMEDLMLYDGKVHDIVFLVDGLRTKNIAHAEFLRTGGQDRRTTLVITFENHFPT